MPSRENQQITNSLTNQQPQRAFLIKKGLVDWDLMDKEPINECQVVTHYVNGKKVTKQLYVPILIKQ